MASSYEATKLDENDGGKITKTTMTSMFKTEQTECDVESLTPGPDRPPISTHTPSLAFESIIFIKRKGSYIVDKQNRFRNSLLAGVGFLELANAGDFAANVWNKYPVPIYAVVLMALGATVALSISYFGFFDARLSLRNIRLLRQERYLLETQKEAAVRCQNKQMTRSIEGVLAVNYREMGTELIDRIGMDLVMGFGATLVGIGTFMAIGGANRKVFLASNLLSGYIGNAPVALFGLSNTVWSIFVWRRAYRHGIAGARELKTEDQQLLKHLNRRLRSVKTHATMNGITGIIAGAASLITATMWWGYPILVPCIISSILCNYMFRHRIGYGRPLIQEAAIRIDKMSLIKELTFVISAQQILKEETSLNSLSKLVSNPESIPSVIEFIIKYDLFEDFCIRLLKDKSLSSSLFDPLDKEELTIESESLLMADKRFLPYFLETAQSCINEVGLTRFQHRERYLLETLGCYLCIPEEHGEILSSEKVLTDV